ncbi:protein PLASTID MOVEMENT IMPAIRED 15-like [Nicotiana tomentosiformis]|uniref:protein PLASTID MOVEMENT IMPAIRED 15-like n=1 Tax=Nicotiana tomentosiformis TaxID=4098 RepID=UPI00388CB1EB
MPPDSIRRLRDELEEGEEKLAYVLANVVIQQSSESAEVDKGNLAIILEQGKAETIPSRAKMVKGETEGKPSRAENDILRDELGVINISTDIHGFLDGLELATSEEIIRFGGLSASVLHHKAFLRIREEHGAEVWNLTKKSDSYKLLSEKLRADLVWQRLEQIGQLNSQVDELLDEAKKFKDIDVLALKREFVQVQLELAETQLRAAEENASVQIKKVKELQHRLDLATSNKAGLADELEVAKSEVAEANKRVDAKVSQFRIDVEVNQAKAKSMVEHAKWQAWREAFEEVSAQGFDVAAEIENAKAEETRARRLDFPEEDSKSLSKFEDGENPEDAASDEHQAT